MCGKGILNKQNFKQKLTLLNYPVPVDIFIFHKDNIKQCLSAIFQNFAYDKLHTIIIKS